MAKAVRPRWHKGPPDAHGLWIVMQNHEWVAAVVHWDKHEEDGIHIGETYRQGERYLRIEMDGDSWPLSKYPWQMSPAFGPITRKPPTP